MSENETKATPAQGGLAKYICKRPNCMMFYEKSYKKFDPIRGEIKVPSKVLKFTQFARRKDLSYIVLDMGSEEDKKKAACIEKSVDWKIGNIAKHPSSYFPTGEKSSIVKTAELDDRPKDRFLRLFKAAATWSCPFCGWQSIKESIQYLYDHLRVQHGVDTDKIPLDGGTVEATDGKHKGQKVSVYRSKSNLDTAISQSIAFGHMGSHAKEGNTVEIVEATREGNRSVKGKVVRISKHSVAIQSEDGRIDDIRKTNVESVKVDTK